MHQKKYFFLFLFFFLSCGIFFLPHSATSAGLQYTLLEKIPGFSSTDGSDLPAYIIAIYKLGLAIVTLSAVLMISIGGFLYLTSAGNTSSMGTAKGIIFDAVIGLVIALSSWVLLNVINPDLTTITLQPITTGIRPVTPVIPVTPTLPSGAVYTHSEAKGKLANWNIPVTSSGNCSDQNNPACTSLEGIPKSTIDNIIKLKHASGCEVTVTGGTETGHVSHGTGKPVVDVSQDTCLFNYFKKAEGGKTLTSETSIEKICTTAQNQPVAFNCTYKEPKAHFHLVFSL